nr:hypothetical protein [uncultured Chitinophaga sp.]
MRNNQQPYTLRSFNIHIFIACLWGGILTAAGCRKIDPIKYLGKDVLYFLNTRESDDYDSLLTGKFSKTLVISFFQQTLPVDTLYLVRHVQRFNKNPFDALRVRLAGSVKSVDRKFSIAITGPGAKYCILPPPDAMKIAAGTGFCPVDLRLLRPPLTDTNSYSVTVSLVDNEYFTPTLHAWYQFQCVFGNIVEQPNRGWSDDRFGPFSREKLMAMLDAVNWAPPSVKNTLKEKYVSKFDPGEPIPQLSEPFTLNDLYLLLNEIAYGLGSDEPYLKTFADITKDYLSYRKKQGNPVLDGSGQEMQFP